MSTTQLSTPVKCLLEDNQSKASIAVIDDFHSDSLIESIDNLVIAGTGDSSNKDEIYLTNKTESLDTVTCSNSSKIDLDQSNTNDSSKNLNAKENVNMDNINTEKISIYLDQQCICNMHTQKILQKSIGIIEALENIGSTLSKDELRNYIDELSQYREQLINAQILSINDKQITRRIQQKFKKISSDYQSAMHECEILKDENLKLIIIQTKLIEEKKKTLDKCNEFCMPFCLDAEKISSQLKVFLLKLALNTQKEEERFREELQKLDIKEKLMSLKNTKLEKEKLEKELEKENQEKEMEKAKLEKEILQKEKLKKELEKEKLEKEKLKKEIEKEKLDKQKLKKEMDKDKWDKQKLEKEMEKDKWNKQILEKEMAKLKLEIEKLENGMAKEKLEKEKLKKEMEKEKWDKQKLKNEMEKDKWDKQILEKEVAKLKLEIQNLENEMAKVKLEKEQVEKGMAKNVQRIISSVGSLHEKMNYMNDDGYY